MYIYFLVMIQFLDFHCLQGSRLPSGKWFCIREGSRLVWQCTDVTTKTAAIFRQTNT